jgi:hypothetical protein
LQIDPISPVYAELVALTRKTLGTVPVLREALQALLPDLQSASEFERRRAEPDSFVNRVLSQPTLPLLGEIKGVVDEPA